MKARPITYRSILDPKSEKVLEHVFYDRMEYLGLMSSAVVHQLQIPLIIMRGRVESFLRHPELSPQQTLSEMSKEFEHLLKLLDSMIFVTPKNKEIKMEVLGLKKTIEKLMLIFESVCVENAISYQINIDENLNVFSEPNRIKNILIALVSNAVDSFRGRDKSKPRNILFHTHFDDQGIHLIISDTGCGMNEETQSKLLTEAFFSTKQQHSSSGLGLALARKMASDLGLDIRFISYEGQGSSFSLTFPKKNLQSLDSVSQSSSSSVRL